jgi:hypothetical protein
LFFSEAYYLARLIKLLNAGLLHAIADLDGTNGTKGIFFDAYEEWL